MKQNLTLLLMLALTSGCATMLPSEERKLDFVETTKSAKAASYTRTLAYLSKKFGDAHSAIKLQDAGAAQIIAKGNVQCNVLRQWGDINEYSLIFDMDFQAKDNKVRLAFENLEMIHAKNGAPVEWDYNQISSAANLAKAKECLQPVRDGVLKAIGGPAQDW